MNASDKLPPRIYSLCEAVADLAMAFAEKPREELPDDSRETCHLCIEWAVEFEEKHKGVVWGVTDGPDYLDAIEMHFVVKHVDWLRENGKAVTS